MLFVELSVYKTMLVKFWWIWTI